MSPMVVTVCPTISEMHQRHGLVAYCGEFPDEEEPLFRFSLTFRNGRTMTGYGNDLNEAYESVVFGFTAWRKGYSDLAFRFPV